MKRIFAGAFFMVVGGNAFAQTSFPSGLAVGVGVSATSGLNLLTGYHNKHIETYWARHFGVRADFATSDPLKSAIDSVIESYMKDGRDVGDGVKIDEGKLDAWHGALFLDFYPFAGNWRMTGGYVWGGATLKSSVFGEIEQIPSQRFYFYLVGDHYYYNGNNFDGSATIDWNYRGPYIGTGFDVGLFCGFALYMDFGVVFTNRPAKLSLDIPQNQLFIYDKTSEVWEPVSLPQLDEDIERAERDANRDLSDFKFYPMVKLGFLYRF